jgi:hypothetical protein
VICIEHKLSHLIKFWTLLGQKDSFYRILNNKYNDVSNETLLPDWTARKKGTFVSFYIDHFLPYRTESVSMHKLFAQSRDTSGVEQKCEWEIEEHQAYKISKLLAQKIPFSHEFSRVRTCVIHNVRIAFLSGSNASIVDLVQLLNFRPRQDQ